MWRYHGPGPAKCKSLYETSLLSWAQDQEKNFGGPWAHGSKKKTLGALGPWAQEENFGGPGPMRPRKKPWGPWALGPSDPSLMALALFFSCIPCSGSLFCPFPNGPGPRPLAFLLCYNPCRPPGLIWPNTWGPNPDSKLAKRRDHHEKNRDGNTLHCKDCYSSLLFLFFF